MDHQTEHEARPRGRGARRTDAEKLADLERKAEELRQQMRQAEKVRADRRCILAGGVILDAAAKMDAHGEAARELLRALLPAGLRPAEREIFADILPPTTPVDGEAF